MNSLEAAQQVIARLHQHGFEALLAGGCVRDRLLGLTPKDHDVATNAPPAEVVRLFRRTKQVGAQFGVVLVAIGGEEVEVATFRTDGDYLDGRRPVEVTYGSAEEDARRRDFTINGMFYDVVADRVVDYVGGMQDLSARLIRSIGEPHRRFAEDHLRLLRAVRFAARLDFEIEPATYQAICALAPRIALISAERIRGELELILTHDSRARGWRLIVQTGLHQHLVPSLAWTGEQAELVGRTLEVIERPVSSDLAFAVVLQGRSAADVQQICRELRFSNDSLKTVSRLVTAAPDLAAGERLELADLKQLMAERRLDDGLRLARAVCCATGASVEAVEKYAARAARIPPEAAAPPPLVTGEDLAALRIPTGPLYGRVLDSLYRAQRNEQLTTREQALEQMRRLIEESRTS